MHMHELHNNLLAVRALSPVAVGTSGTGKTSKIIDRQNSPGVEFLINYGAITSATGVFTALLTECDTTGGSFTSVADADMLGTEALAGLAAGTRVSGSTMNITKKLGYIGSKRYLKLKISGLGTAGMPISIDALMMPNIRPASQPATQ